ncbi:MAG: pantoate--beta-alanine ligase [Bacteroidota bacterium]|nr:pantoate--beta-alanine ligase [Bacteroidota bacterium]
MKIISSIKEMQRISDELRLQSKKIAVVPTMGYLHEGHLSLMKIAKINSDVLVTTIFVNPTQFGPNEDFNTYPRDIESDKELAGSIGTDILFIPTREEMYPSDFLTYIEIEKITNVLEGKSRPTHFRGVTTVVAKLFNITKPNIAVFGQKDAQQAIVIQQMVKNLNFDIEILIAPIVRESDGLAMSSRNTYLSEAERKESVALYQSLQLAKKLIEDGEWNCSLIISEMKKLISTKPSAKIDYISIADAETLEELPVLQDGKRMLISLAVRFGTTRLIDNIIITK